MKRTGRYSDKEWEWLWEMQEEEKYWSAVYEQEMDRMIAEEAKEHRDRLLKLTMNTGLLFLNDVTPIVNSVKEIYYDSGIYWREANDMFYGASHYSEISYPSDIEFEKSLEFENWTK
jgi:hypothetical protein